MRKQFVKTVGEVLENNEDGVLLLGDIGVFGFRNEFKKYPERVYNIGILEQSTISLAAGLSKVGLVPIVHTIAPFMIERSLEQLKIDFGYQGLGGNFVSIGNSYDYAALGPTHHCPGDVQQLLTIPNMEIIVPGNSQELDSLFKECFNNNKPTYYRLSEHENDVNVGVKFGKGNVIKKGEGATIICIGNMLGKVLDATEDMDVTILYYTTINPFDGKLLKENFNENIIVVEPFYSGSFNYKINETLQGKKYSLTNVGVPHNFLINYGDKNEHDLNLNLDNKGIKKILKKCL
jgi:transketolase